MDPTSVSVMTISWYKMFLNASLATLGGIVRLLSKKDSKGNVVKPTLLNLIGSIVCAMFTGVIVYFVCTDFKFSSEMTAALTAASGYLGPVIIDWSFLKLQKFVDKKIDNS